VSARPVQQALFGREPEREAIDGLLAAARDGSSGVLVFRGEVGVGKTALLEYAIRAAPDMQVVRVGGVVAEMELPFAALDQLLRPLHAGLDDLPPPQRAALSSAFGLTASAGFDRFLVGLAVLTLLSNAAEQRPLLCAVDDADSLDKFSAESLAFVARRLGAERIAVFFAIDASDGTLFEGLPSLHVERISDRGARQLVAHAQPKGLESTVRETVIAAAEGNPLALLEFLGALTPDQLVGRSPLPDPLPIGALLEESLLRRLRSLPLDTQTLLLLLSAERSGDPGLFWRAATRLGLARDALIAAEPLLATTEQLAFRHGLMRSVIYGSAAGDARRAVHAALAAELDPVDDQDRAAWHRAAASEGPDEGIAAALEQSARKAQDRGGFAAAAAVLEVAARLTPDSTRRAARMLRAAQTELQAGASARASSLASSVPIELLDEDQRAQLKMLQGSAALASGEVGAASDLLLQAAHAFESLDLRQARDAHLAALQASIYAGRLGAERAQAESAHAALAAPPMPVEELTATDFLLDGFGLLLTEGYAPAVHSLRRGVQLIRKYGDLRWVGPAYIAAWELWDDEALSSLPTRHVELAREVGALAVLPRALSQLGAFEVLVGRFEVAENLVEEAGEIAAVTNYPIVGTADPSALLLAAWRGQDQETRALAQACMRDATARGIGAFIGLAHWTLAILNNGLGRYEEALAAAENACMDTLLITRTLPELVEAATHSNRPELASAAVKKLAESTRASGTDWALGTLAQAQALTSPGHDAEVLFRTSITHLQRCRMRAHLARAELLFGEWLRRGRRRREARGHLREACEMFESMGAKGFAARAAAELAASGERVRRRSRETVHSLTPHERRIARLVSNGATSSQVAAQLFISPRTVEYHLSKIFRKLGISSRTELAGALGEVRNEGST
jgi:DNA-binding CsgD family transcriptional regulator